MEDNNVRKRRGKGVKKGTNKQMEEERKLVQGIRMKEGGIGEET